jgi:tRNA (guanine37-N1)-methyltransferase
LKKLYGLVTPKKKAQNVIQELGKLQIIDNRFQILRTNDLITIPLLREPTNQELSEVKQFAGEVTIQQNSFPEDKLTPRNLREAVQGVIPKKLVSIIPRPFDIIGDIGVVELPRELEPFATQIGDGILRINPRLRLVLKKSGSVSGAHRTREFQTIAGSGGTETTYHEFSCTYRLDVGAVYFNPRLSHERMRVAEQVEENEIVVDMFAGVGPYSILIARQQPQVKVYSIDINANAVKYLEENTLLNKVADRVIPILGDSSSIVSNQLQQTATRVIMNFPSDAKEFLGSAVDALRQSGGIVHFYTFASRTENINVLKENLSLIVQSHRRRVKAFLFEKAIKEVAPNRVQVALDLHVS